MNRPLHSIAGLTLLFVFVLTLGAVTEVCRAQTPVDSTFARVEDLRAQGRFDEAIAQLTAIIQEHKRSGDTLRRAYNDLVFTHLSKRNASSDKSEYDQLQEELIASSREALQMFPDLEPNPVYPPEIKTIYDLQRTAMFGKLDITANVDSCRVFLAPKEGGAETNSYRGMTPLSIRYIPVGDYQLTVTRSGYQDRVAPLSVSPSAVILKEVTLSQERSKKWWLTRVVAPAAIVGGVVAGVLIHNGNSTGDTSHPLDEPPPPPAR